MNDLFGMRTSDGLMMYFNSKEKAAEYFDKIADSISENPIKEIANMRQLAAALRGKK